MVIATTCSKRNRMAVVVVTVIIPWLIRVRVGMAKIVRVAELRVVGTARRVRRVRVRVRRVRRVKRVRRVRRVVRRVRVSVRVRM